MCTTVAWTHSKHLSIETIAKSDRLHRGICRVLNQQFGQKTHHIQLQKVGDFLLAGIIKRRFIFSVIEKR